MALLQNCQILTAGAKFSPIRQFFPLLSEVVWMALSRKWKAGEGSRVQCHEAGFLEIAQSVPLSQSSRISKHEVAAKVSHKESFSVLKVKLMLWYFHSWRHTGLNNVQWTYHQARNSHAIVYCYWVQKEKHTELCPVQMSLRPRLSIGVSITWT